MSFGEHIEELRKCLVRALYGLGVGCVIGFMYADQIVRYLQRPLEVAIQQYDQEMAKQEMIQKYGYFDPEFDYWIENQKHAPRTVLISRDQLSVATGQLAPPAESMLLGLDIEPNQIGVIANRLVNSEKTIGGDKQRDEAGLGAVAIWKHLNQSEQSQIRKLATQKQFTEEDSHKIKSMLGRVAKESQLYNDPAFSHLTEKAERGWFSWLTDTSFVKPLPLIKQRIDKSAGQESFMVRKLNRALIRSAFENELTPPRAELVPIEIWESVSVETQSLSPHEPFMIWMKAGFFAGLVLSSPWILYQLWTFVSAGLYPHEKRYVHWYMPISVLLFLAGVSLAFFFVLTPVLGFLFKFNATMGIAPQLRINYWLSFVMYLPVGFGVAFQLPLVMLVLNRLGIIEISVYLNKWRIAILIIFVLSMLLTPADPLSMILLAIPLTLLYFFGIALCRWMPSNRNPFGEIHEPA